MNGGLSSLLTFLLLAPSAAQAEQATYTVRSLTGAAALKAAEAALASCNASGYQVAVAVVDRSGVPLVMLRDRFAGAHTPDTAMNKAWTAASFRQLTSDLAKSTQPGQPASGIRQLPRVVAVGGGVPVEAGGTLIGAIGVSGAPGGDADESCAKAGIESIREDLEF